MTIFFSIRSVLFYKHHLHKVSIYLLHSKAEQLDIKSTTWVSIKLDVENGITSDFLEKNTTDGENINLLVQ